MTMRWEETGLAEALNSDNLDFVEDLFQQYQQDPTSVEAAWRRYFDGLAAREAAAGGNGAPARLGPSFAPSSIFNPPAPTAATPGRPPAPLPEARPATPQEIADRVPFLMKVPLFRDVPEEEVGQIAKVATELEFEDGEYLFRQGEVGSDLFLILEGAVIVWAEGEIRTELHAGETVGELAVLDSAPRIADAIARGPVRALRLSGDELLRRIEKRPELSRGVMRGLTNRLRERRSRQDRVDQLIRSYRVRGHLQADLNPLVSPRRDVQELSLDFYGLSEGDLDQVFSSTTIPGTTIMRLKDIVERMSETYCGSIGVQFMHIDSLQAKSWLQRRLEEPEMRRRLSRDEQLRILRKLTDAELFEQFIHRKFLGAKRFSLEGAETLIPLLDLAIDEAAGQGVDEIVIGMAHRGRLNVLANILEKSRAQIFREFADTDADQYRGRGDVKYHLGTSTDRVTDDGRKIHLSLCFNPSHLEFVGPVVMGRVRAKQDRFGDADRERAMGIVIHGDAAIAGQGVVQEMLNMSELKGYETGGTLHIVVNNQIGFTTPPELGRSTRYATDVAKMLQTPIFHVNGEHPEAVAHVIRMAMDYRRRFRTDVFIDMYCYRRYGHNEGDEPAFTQPLLYNLIDRQQTVREGYLESLLQLGEVSEDEAQKIAEEQRQELERELERAKSPDYEPKLFDAGGGVWTGYRGGADAEVPPADTSLAREVASQLLEAQTQVPSGFTPHKKIAGLLETRRAMARGEKTLDWGAGEALAFASLLALGHPVRLAGQDSGRGTFSHRHAVLHDFETGALYLPLSHLPSIFEREPAGFEVWDSPLSEIGPMAFEYGYSLDRPDALTCWEAQFGDFSNVAQIIIDQFISSSEDKWRRLNSLVLLLPHGFEGQGPEHSSARLERFLTLCADDNMQVVNLTTPAQLFHALRRQVLRPLRKPMVVMSPKSLLRHKRAVSTLEELAEGGFQRLIPDSQGGPVKDPAKVRRVLLTSGKLFYELEAFRETKEAADVALMRLEQYYPLPLDQLIKALAPYPDGTEVVWVQEEPENMGARTFLLSHLGTEIDGRWPLSFESRRPSSSPATGSATMHKKEQQELLERAFAES